VLSVIYMYRDLFSRAILRRDKSGDLTVLSPYF